MNPFNLYQQDISQQNAQYYFNNEFYEQQQYQSAPWNTNNLNPNYLYDTSYSTNDAVPVAAAPPPPSTPPPPPPPPAPEPPTEEELTSAYSPSRADDDEMDLDGDTSDPQEQQLKLAREREALLQEQIALEAKQREKELREREEHDRLVEAENRKKRKLANRFGTSLSKLKRVELKAFGGDDDDEIDNKNSNEEESNDHSSNNNIKQSTSSNMNVESKISDEILQVILKTATWAANNPDKITVLLENSKNNPKLKFLFDRESPAGIRYLEELQRIRTQLEVQQVCSAVDSDLSNDHVSRQPYGVGVGNLGGNVYDASSPLLQSTNNNSISAEIQRAILDHVATTKATANAIANVNFNFPAPSSLSLAAISAQAQMAMVAALIDQKTAVSSSTTVSTVQETVSDSAADDKLKRKKERKNRWGPPAAATTATTNTTPAATSILPTSTLTAATAISSTPSTISVFNTLPLVISVTPPVMDAKMAAQIREQKELQLLESRIREAAAAALKQNSMTLAEREEALHQERLRQYQELAEKDDEYKDTIEDAETSNGVIEGGTWEHRKRAKEMIATANKNLELTLLSSGKHHIADFLPKTELEKFLNKADAITTGQSVITESDYLDNKIDEDNVGFQMLKKAGWTQGEGLGLEGSGIAEPLNINANVVESAGVGVHATHEVESGDTAFEQYRKRMMLAYRFRPNPLNNPRRDYY